MTIDTQAMRHRSIGALLGLRVILVANIVLLTVLGVLFLMSYEHPVAYVFAGLAWLAALVLSNLVRFTDPSARPRGNRRSSRNPARADRGSRSQAPD
jgi:predicted lysophospholipase L1 biosynthesis ABC-type transport system permease subunit